MIRVILGILLLAAVALYFVWRRKAKPVLEAQEDLEELRLKREALEVQERVLDEQQEVAELEKALAERAVKPADDVK
jgi:hypothetical protein